MRLTMAALLEWHEPLECWPTPGRCFAAGAMTAVMIQENRDRCVPQNVCSCEVDGPGGAHSVEVTVLADG